MAGSVRPEPHPDIGTELVRDWAPEDNPKAFIVLVHGLAEHSGRYERTADLLARSGFAVRSFDLIGAGATGGRRWDIDDWGRYHDQIGTHVDWAGSQGKPVVLMGHSLGGNLALGYVLSDRTSPDLLVLSAPALAGGAGWQRTLAPIIARLAPKLAVPNMLDTQHLSRDPDVIEAYLADPLVVTKSTVRFGVQLFEEIDDLNRRLHELDIPTLVVHGSDDRIVPTWSSESLGELPNCERRIYDGLRHESLNEPEGPDVVADIVAWINDRV